MNQIQRQRAVFEVMTEQIQVMTAAINTFCDAVEYGQNGLEPNLTLNSRRAYAAFCKILVRPEIL